MNRTFEQIIEPILSSLPAQAILNDNLLAIRNIAMRLPPPGLFCLEFHVSRETPQVDFLLCISENDRSSFQTYAKSMGATNTKAGAEGWRRIGHILNRWAEEENLWFHMIRNVWLTFDLPSGTTSLPDPWAYCLLQSQPKERSMLPIWAQSLLSMMWGETTDTYHAPIADTLNLLPKEAHLFGLSRVNRQKTTLARLILAELNPASIIPYLTQLQWGGNMQQIKKIIPCLSHCSSLSLLLDHTETLKPNLGIECWFDRHGPIIQVENTLLALQSLGIFKAPDTDLLKILNTRNQEYDSWINHLKIKLIQGKTPRSKSIFSS